MSFNDWELSGGLDPSVEPDTDDDRFLCSCGHPQCWLLGNDVTNVLIDGKWYAADCVGLCWPCGAVDDLRNLVKIGGYLMHETCAAGCPIVVEGLEAAARSDEFRDDFNRVRR